VIDEVNTDSPPELPVQMDERQLEVFENMIPISSWEEDDDEEFDGNEEPSGDEVDNRSVQSTSNNNSINVNNPAPLFSRVASHFDFEAAKPIGQVDFHINICYCSTLF
jgi:hypothetical protein